jgi:hypothetical protein
MRKCSLNRVSASIRWIPSRLFGIACVGLLATACATGPVNDVACPDSSTFRRLVTLGQTGAELTAAATRKAVEGSYQDTVVRTLLAPPPERKVAPTVRAGHQIAVLSGGGQYGAYGAGFLSAWRQNAGEDTVFTLVTGVSTGALQSTLVFLGEDNDYADLVDAYSIESETDVATMRASIFGIPLTNSFYSLDPGRARIEEYITVERVRRVADAANLNRKLLVGVVDARDGEFYAFDLTALAASDMDEQIKRQCYVEVLMASSAVPVIFPPIYLDGFQYYDGGVRASVFFDATVNALRLAAERSATMDSVYLVFNGYLEIQPKPDLENSILATALRTKDIAFDQIDRFSVASVFQLSDRYDVRWARIPYPLCLEEKQSAPDEDVFNAPLMACLIEKGAEAGGAPDPWLAP